MDEPQSLDEWYRLVNSIYFDRNYYRNAESVLAHLIEVAGGLSLFATKKHKGGVEPREFLAKSLGWWMALCGKVGIRSIETVIWTKFPYVCPYCRLPTHDEIQCKQVRRKSRTIQWDLLQKMAENNSRKRPKTLADWQKMFYAIYPRNNPTAHDYNFGRLAEELGELSEAVRLLPVSHSYFMNEAADVFAWLMGQANQAELDISEEHEIGAFLESSFRSEYPMHCRVCKGRICRCPPIISSSIQRLSREMPAEAFPDPSDLQVFSYHEALEFFRVQEETITVANRKIEVTFEFLEDFSRINRELRGQLEEQTKLQREVKENVIRIFSDLESIAASQQLTQANINEIVEDLRTLPPDAQSVLVDFLTSMAGGVWVEVLLTLLKLR